MLNKLGEKTPKDVYCMPSIMLQMEFHLSSKLFVYFEQCSSGMTFLFLAIKTIDSIPNVGTLLGLYSHLEFMLRK